MHNSGDGSGAIFQGAAHGHAFSAPSRKYGSDDHFPALVRRCAITIQIQRWRS